MAGLVIALSYRCPDEEKQLEHIADAWDQGYAAGLEGFKELDPER